MENRTAALPATRLPLWFSGKGNDADVVISTRIRLARNCSLYPFPHRASLLQRKHVFETVADAFRDSPQYNSFECVNFIELTRTEQQFLVEERIASPDLITADGDRGVIFNGTGRITILVNEEDHIRLQCMDAGCCPLALWNTIDGIDDDIGMRVSMAFDNCRGFLTSSPANSGTGLRVSFLMHLPALILTKTIDQILLGASQMGVSTCGFSHEHWTVTGSLFQISNVATIGATESECLNSTLNVIRKVIEFERAARQQILNEAHAELLDKINRAYGILAHATMLDIDEFLNLSSALRLGIECTLFNSLTISQLNRLTLLVMPAHLQKLNKHEMTDNELRSARAKLVRHVIG